MSPVLLNLPSPSIHLDTQKKRLGSPDVSTQAPQRSLTETLAWGSIFFTAAGRGQEKTG